MFTSDSEVERNVIGISPLCKVTKTSFSEI